MARPVHVIAAHLDVNPRTLASWLEWHPEAYWARLAAIEYLHIAHAQGNPRIIEWHRSIRRSNLTLCREAHGLPFRHRRKRPAPRCADRDEISFGVNPFHPRFDQRGRNRECFGTKQIQIRVGELPDGRDDRINRRNSHHTSSKSGEYFAADE